MTSSYFKEKVDNLIQGRSQNAEKITHIKRRLLDQAMILFSNGNVS